MSDLIGICFLMLGILLVACGTVAIVIPPLFTYLTAMVLGIVLMVSGIVTIVSSFWIGKWSGLLLHLLVGILYLVAGFVINRTAGSRGNWITLFIAVYVYRRRIVQNCECTCSPFSSLGLGIVQRHYHIALRHCDLSPFTAKLTLGDRNSGRRRIAVQRLDLDHALAGHPIDSRRIA